MVREVRAWLKRQSRQSGFAAGKSGRLPVGPDLFVDWAFCCTNCKICRVIQVVTL